MSESVAILGGRGMLGSDVAAALRSQGCTVTIWDLPEWDLTCAEHVDQALRNAQVYVNCAAYTQVDKAEDEPGKAMLVNADAVAQLGTIARRLGVYGIHISTDFVFDGAGERPYVETDLPKPLSVYGASKWTGEVGFFASGCAGAVLRVQWSYGAQGSHFVAKILERARTGVELKVVDDQVGAPTWTADMARAIGRLIQDRQEGLFHFANGGYVSRYDMACFLIRTANLTNRVTPCSSDLFPAKALRPRNSRFDTTKIQSVLDYPIRSWQDAVGEFLRG